MGVGPEGEGHRTLMAGVARSNGLDVVRRLRDSDLTVVAIGARRSRLQMINQPNVVPQRGLVTALAYGRCFRMVLRLPCSNRSAVASEALARRGFEVAGSVTGRAVDRDMAAREGETSRKMTE